MPVKTPDVMHAVDIQPVYDCEPYIALENASDAFLWTYMDHLEPGSPFLRLALTHGEILKSATKLHLKRTRPNVDQLYENILQIYESRRSPSMRVDEYLRERDEVRSLAEDYATWLS